MFVPEQMHAQAQTVTPFARQVIHVSSHFHCITDKKILNTEITMCLF